MALKYVSPEYNQRLEDLADSLMIRFQHVGALAVAVEAEQPTLFEA